MIWCFSFVRFEEEARLFRWNCADAWIHQRKNTHRREIMCVMFVLAEREKKCVASTKELKVIKIDFVSLIWHSVSVFSGHALNVGSRWRSNFFISKLIVDFLLLCHLTPTRRITFAMLNPFKKTPKCEAICRFDRKLIRIFAWIRTIGEVQSQFKSHWKCFKLKSTNRDRYQRQNICASPELHIYVKMRRRNDSVVVIVLRTVWRKLLRPTINSAINDNNKLIYCI